MVLAAFIVCVSPSALMVISISITILPVRLEIFSDFIFSCAAANTSTSVFSLLLSPLSSAVCFPVSAESALPHALTEKDIVAAKSSARNLFFLFISKALFS